MPILDTSRSSLPLTALPGREQAGGMKRWQLELMGVMLLTLALAYLRVILLVPILWLAVHAIVSRAAGKPVYWLEDAYALVPLEGVARTLLRGIVSLILASVAAIVFAVAYTVGYALLVQPVDGVIYSGWMAWVLLFAGFAVPFNVTWKMLPQRDHRYTARL
jgi:hypothetical protein